jgi:hypothetical protein
VDAKYKFYEVVRVNEKHYRSMFVNKEGAILGMSQNEQNDMWGYTLTFDDLPETYGFEEEELEPTGKMKKREDFYDGSSVTVVVDPDTGEGRIIAYNDPQDNKE